MTPPRRSKGIELKMAFAPGMVSIVRRFVESASERLGISEEASVAVAMAAHELLENVAKYGTNREGTLRLDLEPEGEGQRARLVMTVANQSDPDHIDRLKQLFRDMNAAADPMGYYFSLIQRIVPEGESGVGLARVQAEADMVLGLTMVGDTVRISATSRPFTPTTGEEIS